MAPTRTADLPLQVEQVEHGVGLEDVHAPVQYGEDVALRQVEDVGWAQLVRLWEFGRVPE